MGLTQIIQKIALSGSAPKFFTLIFFTFLVGCKNSPQINNYEVKGNLAATNPLGCVSATLVDSENTAADIVVGAKDCTSQSKYSEASELIMVASAYAFYDTHRVADKTAHGAFNALIAKEFSSLSEPERNKLFSSIDALDKDKSRKTKLCSHLNESSPPTYYPNYMIAHGMSSFIGSVKKTTNQ